MKKSLLLISCIITLIILSNCSSDDPKPQGSIKNEILTKTELAFWDNLESEKLTLSEIILPNGLTISGYNEELRRSFPESSRLDAVNLGPQAAKNALIKELGKAALELTTRSNFTYSNEGVGNPAQNGLAYSYGQRDHTERLIPPNGQCKSDAVFGLDCSGFIYQIFKKAGVDLGTGSYADTQRKPAKLQKAIQAGYPGLEKILVDDLGKIAPSKFETGDIIYWKRSDGTAYHIGMVMKKSNGSIVVAQSNGSDGSKGTAGDCEKNYGTSRGPRLSNVERAILPSSQNGFGDDYGIVRINAEISGNWLVELKCQGSSFKWLSLNIDFPTSESQSFSRSASEVYEGDGVQYDVAFDFTFDRETNTLTSTFETTATSLPNFYRYDSFSKKLELDDTGYFQATLGDSQDAGCPIDVRLINLEETSVTTTLVE